MSLTIQFYKMSCEANRINKAGFLEVVRQCEGTFRGDVSVTNPVIEVELERQDEIFNGINYAYIMYLRRYYFVTNIVITTNRTCVFYFAVDPLFSWQEDIMKLKALVGRYEHSEEYMLYDNDLPTKSVPTFDLLHLYSKDVKWTVKNSVLDPTWEGEDGVYNYLIFYVGNGEGLLPGDEASLDMDGVLGGAYSSPLIAAVDQKGLRQILDKVGSDSNLATFVFNIIATNIDFKQVIPAYTENKDLRSIHVGSTEIGFFDQVHGMLWVRGRLNPITYSVNITQAIRGYIQKGRAGEFLISAPQYKVSIWLPYYGWYDVNVDLFKQFPYETNNLYVDFMFYVEPASASAQVIVKYRGDETDMEIIADTLRVSTGVSLPVSSDGSADRNRINAQLDANRAVEETNRYSSFANDIIGILAGGATGAVGLATGHPTLVAGGVSAIASNTVGGIADALQASHEETAYEVAKRNNLASGTIKNGGAGGYGIFPVFAQISPYSATYAPEEAIVLISYTDILESSTEALNEYAHLHGLPYYHTQTLSDLTRGSFFSVVDVHVEGFPCTVDERKAIFAALKAGAIV